MIFLLHIQTVFYNIDTNTSERSAIKTDAMEHIRDNLIHIFSFFPGKNSQKSTVLLICRDFD